MTRTKGDILKGIFLIGLSVLSACGMFGLIGGQPALVTAIALVLTVLWIAGTVFCFYKGISYLDDKF